MHIRVNIELIEQRTNSALTFDDQYETIPIAYRNDSLHSRVHSVQYRMRRIQQTVTWLERSKVVKRWTTWHNCWPW